jgi:hypothetical protein
MSSNTWLASFHSTVLRSGRRSSARPCRRPPARRMRPNMEAMEDRLALATAAYSAGALQITGLAASDTAVTMSSKSNTVEIVLGTGDSFSSVPKVPGISLKAGTKNTLNVNTQLASLRTVDVTLRLNDTLDITPGAGNTSNVVSQNVNVLGGGNLQVTGGSITVNPGVSLTTAQGGNITLTGAGTGSPSFAVDVNGATLNADGGNVTITGSAGASVGEFIGVEIQDGAQVLTTGAGTIKIQGTGNSNTVNTANGNAGVYISSYGPNGGGTSATTYVNARTGMVTITGTGGNGLGNNNDGVVIGRGGLVNGTSVSVTGTTVGLSAGGVGVALAGEVSAFYTDIAASNGTAGGTSNIIGSGLVVANTLVLSADSGIGASGAPLTTQTTNLDASTISGGVFVNNAGNLTVGNSFTTTNGVKVQNSGDVSIATSGNLYVNQPGASVSGPGNISLTSGGLLTVSGSMAVTDNSASSTETLTLTGDGGVTINSGAKLTNNNGVPLNIVVNGTGGSASGGVGVAISGSTLNANGGNVTIIGYGAGNSANGDTGVLLVGASISGTEITMRGTGGNGSGSNNAGLVITEGSTVTAGEAGVNIIGSGGGTGTHEDGMDIADGAQIKATGGGAVWLSGAGSLVGSGNSSGVWIAGTEYPTAETTVTGTRPDNWGVVIQGEASGSGSYDWGVAIVNGANVSATSFGGGVYINGIGGGSISGTDDLGVLISDATTVVSASPLTGSIEIVGLDGNIGSYEYGVLIQSGATIQASSILFDATGGLGSVTDVYFSNVTVTNTPIFILNTRHLGSYQL